MTQTEFRYLMSSIKGLSHEQAHRLRRQLDRQLAEPKKPAARAPIKDAKSALPRETPPTVAEFNQRLLAAGRLASLPDPSLDLDDDDPADAPVSIKGEPLSETILRERR